ncbi:MAG: hypothetical protein RL310_485, partial [Actinomycetota bacterium]
ALNDIALKTNSINNTDGKIQAKNNLKLQDLALNDLSPDWQFKINDQLISINNANGNFYAKNLLEFDLQNANYSIAGDLKSDGKIKITTSRVGKCLSKSEIAMVLSRPLWVKATISTEKPESILAIVEPIEP